MSLFVRLTALIAVGIVALFALAFILKAIVLGAIVAALVLGALVVLNLVRRIGRREAPLVPRYPQYPR